MHYESTAPFAYTYIFKELNDEVLMLVTGGVLHIDIIVGVSGLSPTLLLPGSFNIMISHCIIFDNQSITFSLTMSPSSLIHYIQLFQWFLQYHYYCPQDHVQLSY